MFQRQTIINAIEAEDSSKGNWSSESYKSMKAWNISYMKSKIKVMHYDNNVFKLKR